MHRLAIFVPCQQFPYGSDVTGNTGLHRVDRTKLSWICKAYYSLDS